jgi:hypothetical protein
MRALFICPVLIAAIGCVETPSARVASSEPAPIASPEHAPRGIAPDPEPELAAASGEESRVLVLQTTKLDRYAEVIGVVDVHEAMGTEKAALATLRRKAAAMGADAVVGVEFHHGEGEGEPTHLSGMAVRFVPASSLPQ